MEDKDRLSNVMLNASLSLLFLMMASKGFGYLFHLVFAKSFTQEIYGQYIYLYSLGLLFAGLTPNISAAITRYLAYYRGKEDAEKVAQTQKTGLILTILVTFGITSLSAILYTCDLLPSVQDSVSLSFLLVICSLTLFINYFGSIFVGFRKPEISSTYVTVLNLLRFIAIVFAAYIAATQLQIYSLIALSFFIPLILIFLHAYKKFGLGSVCNFEISKLLFKFGVFTLFLETANNVLSWADIFMIHNILGADSVAIYNIAWLASTTPLIFFLSAINIFKPVVTEFFGKKDLKNVSYLTTYMFESFSLMFFPIFIVLSTYSYEILVYFIGDSYALGSIPLRILAFGNFFYGLALLLMELIAADGKPKINVKNILVAATANIILNLALIPILGMVGSALATLASSTIFLLLSLKSTKNIVALQINIKRIIKLVLAAFFTAISAFTLNIISPITGFISLGTYSAISVIIYSIFIIRLKSLRYEDVSMAAALMKKFKTPKILESIFMPILEAGLPHSKN